MNSDKHKQSILASAYHGDLDSLKAAVKEDPLSVLLKDEFTDCTALHISAGLGNYSCAEFLASCAHINLQDQDYSGLTALERAGVTGHDAVFTLLADAVFPGRHSLGEGDTASKVHKLTPRP